MSADDTTAHPRGPTALAALLRVLRKRALLTQEELAERAGLSATTIKNFETGRVQRPRLESIRLLADTLGLTEPDREALIAAAKGDGPELPAQGGPRTPLVPRPPRLLPATVAGFTGRDRQVKVLEELLGGDGGPAERATAVPICALVGMAGVGKTALAVHWAHRAAARFPDGQLYVNLRGYAAGPPLDPIQALARLLRALGVGADQVPVEAEEAAELYRSLLAGKRVLVVLDNARDPEQVRPLLPGTSGCAVVVTSRDRLAGLVATHGARRLTLDVLTPGEAVDLLRALLGPDRAAEPAATAELARLCANLPLALRIAVANLASYPDRSIGDYVADLRADDRLTRLAVDDDPQAAVGAAFDVSYQRLTAEAQRLFRLLGLVAGPDVTVEAAAALAAAAPRRTADLLDRLVGANLVEARGPDRFTFHDLLRRYAEQRARLDDGEPERHAAVRRLLGWYLRGCDAAARRLYPQMLRLPAPPAEAPPPVTFEFDDAAALAWLDAELPNLVAAVEYAALAPDGLPELAWRLADALRGYFWLRRCKVEWLAVTHGALTAVANGGDPRAHAAVRLSLGDAHDAIDRQLDAIEHYTAALASARQAGWVDGEAGILSNLGLVHWGRGELRTAADHQAQAQALYQRTGRSAGQAIILGNLGLIHAELGQLRQAADEAAQSLALHRELGNRGGQGSALNVLGYASHHLGRFDRALEQLTAALTRSRETGNRLIEACTLDALAALHHDAGRRPEALESAAAAVRLAAELGEHWVEADARTTLGTIELHRGNAGQALDHHAEALELARRARSRSREAAALLGLAAAHLELGCQDQTTDHAGQALALARQTGNRLLEGRAHAAVAAADLARGDADLAAEHAREALAIQREVGHRLGEARTLVLLGHALERASGPDAALPSWREALTLFTDIGSPEAEALHAILPASRPGAR